MPDGNHDLLPVATYESWRTWLMNGTRRGPVDRRRLRGAHRGLKQMLLEGAGDRNRPKSWKEFSEAMVRHSVDEAMRMLPVEDATVVKLAFFGGYSNREIAVQVGVAEATVQRRLREALDKISEYVQRGRTVGRRAFYALLIWISERTLSDVAHHTVQVAAVAAAATIVIAAPAVRPASGSTPSTTSHDRIVQTTTSQPAVAHPAPTPPPLPIPAAKPQPPSGQVITLPSLPSLPPVDVPPLPTPPPIKVPGG